MKKKNGYSVGTTVALAAVFLVICVCVCVALLIQGSSGGLSPESPGGEISPGVQQSQQQNDPDQPGQTTDSKPEPKPLPPLVRKENVYNVLVVGRDAAGSNTDVIMVCSYDVPSGSMAVMQIPRDTYVPDPINEGKTKRINAIYALAYNQAGQKGIASNRRQGYALEYLESVVESTFGIELDRYVYVDLKAFRQIVDIIGGVTVEVPADLDYDDPEQNLHIHIKKGTQRLNGAQAEGFVRYRKGYLEGDLGRLDAQKLFLSALMDQLLSAKNITKIPQLMSSAYEYMITDLSLSDVTYLASTVGGLDLSKIYMLTAPGEAFTTEGGAWYYSLYAEESLQAVNRYLNCYTTDITSERMSLVQMHHEKAPSASDGAASADDIVNKPPQIPMV